MRAVHWVGFVVFLTLITGPVAAEPAQEMLCLDRQRMAMDMRLAELREELRPHYKAILPQVAGWTCTPEPDDLQYEALYYDLLISERCRRGDEEVLVQFSATDRLIADQFEADGKLFIPAARGLSRRNPGYYRSAQGQLYRYGGRLFGRVSDAITVKIERTDPHVWNEIPGDYYEAFSRTIFAADLSTINAHPNIAENSRLLDNLVRLAERRSDLLGLVMDYSNWVRISHSLDKRDEVVIWPLEGAPAAGVKKSSWAYRTYQTTALLTLRMREDAPVLMICPPGQEGQSADGPECIDLRGQEAAFVKWYEWGLNEQRRRMGGLTGADPPNTTLACWR